MRELCDPLQSTSLNGFVGGIPIRDPAARLSQQISKAMLLLTERAGSNLGAGKHRVWHSRGRKLSTGVSVKKFCLFGVENNSALFGLVISGSTVRRRVLAMYWYSCPLCPEVNTLFIFTTCLCVCGYKLLPFRVLIFFFFFACKNFYAFSCFLLSFSLSHFSWSSFFFCCCCFSWTLKVCAHCDAIYLRVFIVGTRQCGERRRVTESADSFDDEAYPCVQNNWTFFFFRMCFFACSWVFFFDWCALLDRPCVRWLW